MKKKKSDGPKKGTQMPKVRAKLFSSTPESITSCVYMNTDVPLIIRTKVPPQSEETGPRVGRKDVPSGGVNL